MIEFLKITGLVLIVIIFGTYVLATLLQNGLINPQVEQNCNNVALSGYETEIRHIKVIGLDIFDCYVKIDENFIPYDRWIGAEVN